MEDQDKIRPNLDIEKDDDCAEGKRRDPEDRPVAQRPSDVRDKMLDKTLADSFPTSDPPSTIPDPEEDDSFAA